MASLRTLASRRLALTRATRWMVAWVAVPIAVLPTQARAAKAMKADFHYQDRPKDGKRCATCRLFAAAADGKGACALVEGEVSPEGYCMAYSPHSADAPG
jgi:hypothetical protein